MAEKDIKIAEQIGDQVVFPSIKELRYAGRRIVDALQALSKSEDAAKVTALLEDARALGVQDVFTLTFVPDFFERLGFACVDRSTLPHKVWQDCTKCALFPDCGETAMILPLTAGHDCCSCGGGDCG